MSERTNLLYNLNGSDIRVEYELTKVLNRLSLVCQVVKVGVLDKTDFRGSMITTIKLEVEELGLR